VLEIDTDQEMQIKLQWDIPTHSLEWIKFKTLTILHVGENVDSSAALLHC
jgi:hypothetical protein